MNATKTKIKPKLNLNYKIENINLKRNKNYIYTKDLVSRRLNILVNNVEAQNWVSLISKSYNSIPFVSHRNQVINVLTYATLIIY